MVFQFMNDIKSVKKGRLTIKNVERRLNLKLNGPKDLCSNEELNNHFY